MGALRTLERLIAMGERVESKIDRLLRLALTGLEGITMTLDELQTQIAANTAVEASAIALIHGLSDQIAAAKSDPAKVQALADQLKASADALGAAVAANTVAAPPVVEPAPVAPVAPTP